jgi:anti-sigma B factor antagonist
MRLAVSIRSVEEIDLLAVEGEIDFGTSDRFGSAISTLVLDRAGEVLVDLRRVGFMDSTGLHHLITAHRRLGRQGRKFALVCAPGPVYDVFVTAGLIDELAVHETRSGAERALS